MKQMKVICTRKNETALSRETTIIPMTAEAAAPHPVENNVVNLYPDYTYQTIIGFGGAMTEAAAYSLSQLSEEKQEVAIREYFGADGISYNVIRTHIDSCDFSRDMYQAVDDVLADPDFATFSLKRDREHIIPAIKAAMAASEKPLAVLLSPWSPPAEWKTPSEMLKSFGSPEDYRKMLPPELADTDLAETNPVVAAIMHTLETMPKDGTGTRTCGGHLKPEYYGAWAAYMTKYIQAYLDEGIPVRWVTIQNESQAATPWDSCQWTMEEQKTFLADHLYPAMEAAGLTDRVSILFWDHNKENLVNWVNAVVDEDTAKMVGGVAFHWYSGDHFEAVQMVHERFPDLQLMFSEGCCEFVKDDPATEVRQAAQYAHDIIGNLNAGMDTWIDWNLYLDKKGGPNHVGNFCSAPVMLDGKGGYENRPTLDYIGHFSRYIQPGAVRIGHSKYTDTIDVTTFQNVDGTIACVVLNRGEKEKPINIRLNGSFGNFTLPANSIATVLIEK